MIRRRTSAAVLMASSKRGAAEAAAPPAAAPSKRQPPNIGVPPAVRNMFARVVASDAANPVFPRNPLLRLRDLTTELTADVQRAAARAKEIEAFAKQQQQQQQQQQASASPGSSGTAATGASSETQAAQGAGIAPVPILSFPPRAGRVAISELVAQTAHAKYDVLMARRVLSGRGGAEDALLRAVGRGDLVSTLSKVDKIAAARRAAPKWLEAAQLRARLHLRAVEHSNMVWALSSLAPKADAAADAAFGAHPAVAATFGAMAEKLRTRHSERVARGLEQPRATDDAALVVEAVRHELFTQGMHSGVTAAGGAWLWLVVRPDPTAAKGQRPWTLQLIATASDASPLAMGMIPVLCVDCTPRAVYTPVREWDKVKMDGVTAAAVAERATRLAAEHSLNFFPASPAGRGNDVDAHHAARFAFASAPVSVPSWSRAARVAGAQATRPSITVGSLAFLPADVQRARYFDAVTSQLNFARALAQIEAAAKWLESPEYTAARQRHEASQVAAARAALEAKLARNLPAAAGEDAEADAAAAAADATATPADGDSATATAPVEAAESAAPVDAAAAAPADAAVIAAAAAAAAIESLAAPAAAMGIATDVPIDVDAPPSTSHDAVAADAAAAVPEPEGVVCDDGSTMYALADGSTEYRRQDGSSVLVQADGVKVFREVPSEDPSALLSTTVFPDGAVEYAYVNGYKIRDAADGTRRTINPDGSYVESVAAPPEPAQ